MPSLALVCATKEPEQHFERSTLLGRSLLTFPKDHRPKLYLLANNKGAGATGLASFYNHAIENIKGVDIIVFLHDDIWIHDWNLAFQLEQALSKYDIVGTIGSSDVPFGQPGWWMDVDDSGSPYRNNLVKKSGSINHFDHVFVRPDYFGPSPMACDLLDGVFMATRLDLLHSSGLRFDSQFKFHCYDSDFCYSARSLGLKIGTWPISLTHGSGGSFDSGWSDSANRLKLKLDEL